MQARLNHGQPLRYVFFAVLWLLLATAPAYALLEEGKYTETEKVGFAFFKLGHIQPPYVEWVKATDLYKDAPPKERAALLEDQTVRLQKGFSLYMPDEDLIKVATIAPVRSPMLSDKDKAGKYHDVKPLQILMAAGPNGYFPFYVGDMCIAIVPEHFDAFQNIMVSNDVYSKMRKYLGIGNYQQVQKAYIEIVFRPNKADTSKPMTLDKTDTWLMSATIINFEVWDITHQHFIWNYTSPAYVSDKTRNLLDLYGK